MAMKIMNCINYLKQIKPKKFLEREINVMITSVILGTVFAVVISTQIYADNVQSEIADNVIRFHVVSNSDDPNCIALKEHVRDGVLDRFGGIVCPTADIEESREILTENLTEIAKFASRLIHHEGYDYPVLAVMDEIFFPTKTYGDVSFPAGVYEAVRIVIGMGGGNNWWCVMFPPLCYVDAASPESDEADESLLEARLSPSTYALMNDGVSVRFRVVEWWQERINS